MRFFAERVNKDARTSPAFRAHVGPTAPAGCGVGPASLAGMVAAALRSRRPQMTQCIRRSPCICWPVQQATEPVGGGMLALGLRDDLSTITRHAALRFDDARRLAALRQFRQVVGVASNDVEPRQLLWALRNNVWKWGHDLEVVPCGNGTTFSSSRFTPPESRNALQSVRWPGQ